MLHLPRLPQDEQEIISGLQLTGIDKVRAEETLFKHYLYFINEGVRKYRLSDDEAFDAYSDSILAVIYAIPTNSFTGSATLRTYTYSIFKNKCVDLFRKKTTNKNSVHLRVSSIELLAELSDTAKSALHALSEEAELQVLDRKLNELGNTCRQLLMSTADGRTDREIADLMKFKTTDVVKSTRLRCLNKLRDMYRILK